MLSKDEVKHIANLSRLDLSEKEIIKMQKNLSSILNYFNLLKKVKKTKSSPNIPTEKISKNTLREDSVQEKSSSLANNLIQMAPDKKDGYIKVKSIL